MIITRQRLEHIIYRLDNIILSNKENELCGSDFNQIKCDFIEVLSQDEIDIDKLMELDNSLSLLNMKWINSIKTKKRIILFRTDLDWMLKQRKEMN